MIHDIVKLANCQTFKVLSYLLNLEYFNNHNYYSMSDNKSLYINIVYKECIKHLHKYHLI